MSLLNPYSLILVSFWIASIWSLSVRAIISVLNGMHLMALNLWQFLKFHRTDTPLLFGDLSKSLINLEGFFPLTKNISLLLKSLVLNRQISLNVVFLPASQMPYLIIFHLIQSFLFINYYILLVIIMWPGECESARFLMVLLKNILHTVIALFTGPWTFFVDFILSVLSGEAVRIRRKKDIFILVMSFPIILNIFYPGE